MTPPRVLLADDHTLVAEAFKQLLEPEYSVVGIVTDGRTLLAVAPKLNPDIILLDISMPLLNGLDAGRRLKQAMPAVKLIYLTVNEDPQLAAEAFRLGAAGYVVKSAAASELFQAIQEVLKGRQYMSPLVRQGLVDSLKNPKHKYGSERLTVRQREVLQLLAEGHAMKQVAATLNITARTVAFHKYRIMDELGFKTNAELIRFAVKQHIVSTADC
jgi:DNA-binding NarL/FixJ family response regulator